MLSKSFELLFISPSEDEEIDISIKRIDTKNSIKSIPCIILFVRFTERDIIGLIPRWILVVSLRHYGECNIFHMQLIEIIYRISDSIINRVSREYTFPMSLNRNRFWMPCLINNKNRF